MTKNINTVQCTGHIENVSVMYEVTSTHVLTARCPNDDFFKNFSLSSKSGLNSVIFRILSQV